MDQKALAAARVRLERAQVAVSAMNHVPKLADLQSAWWTFLLAASGLYSKLEQGSKSSGKSAAWFGRVKHLRKTDPLLSYIHHARNTDEHGVDDSIFSDIGAVSINKDVKIIEDLHNPDNPITIQIPEGLPQGTPLVRMVTGVRLRAVTDARFGDTFLVPTHHLGKKLPNNSVQEVAKAGLAYLENLIDEAGRL